MENKKYKVIDHTADIGIVAYGKDLRELFKNAAFGMFDLMAGLEGVGADKKILIKLKAPNKEELLVSWLSELLYYFAVPPKILFKDFEIKKLEEKSIEAEARGERLDLSRHQMKMEMKAVTYHQLKIEKMGGQWQCRVIFDV